MPDRLRQCGRLQPSSDPQRLCIETMVIYTKVNIEEGGPDRTAGNIVLTEKYLSRADN